MMKKSLIFLSLFLFLFLEPLSAYARAGAGHAETAGSAIGRATVRDAVCQDGTPEPMTPESTTLEPATFEPMTPEYRVQEVLRRTFGHVPANVEFRYTGPADSTDAYVLEARQGKLRISGTSPVAMCKGFHDYIQEHGYGCVTWSGSRLDMPEHLPDMETVNVISPFREHLFYNVCTFGYSLPYWGWKEWEKELDWLALHGFDMPLAPVATEAVMIRVYEQLGLSWEEISGYFSGPGHFPWMRMGNMCSQDGGMGRQWHESQIRLQHRILDRMAELGMTPVFQAFAGFVPEAVGRRFPDTKLTRIDWHGLHNQMLSPTDSLFGIIGSSFIREWEKEFGKGRYYLADNFNENDIPFGPKGSVQRYETIRRYSAATFKSIDDANPDAVWVMQGWMFGRDRKRIWDPHSVKALLDGAPDDRLLIVDLAVDFNEYVWRSEKDWDYLDGFSGKKWIWSTTPNFGGRTSLKGTYDFYLNNHLSALASPSKGRLSGFGCSPEGIECNEALYEAVSSAGWSSQSKDARDFLARYFAARYALEPEDVYPLADGLLESVYGNFTSSDNFNWVSRPNKILPDMMNINASFFRATEHLLSLRPKCRGNRLYESDAIYFTAYYMGRVCDMLYGESRIMLAQGNIEGSMLLKDRMTDILLSCDRLLESHPLMRMQRWLDMADACATGSAERMEFRREALRLVTTWEAEGICDYASRMWSGMIRDYYVPRLEAFYNAAVNGTELDLRAVENSYIETAACGGLSSVRPYEDPAAAADSLIRKHGRPSSRDESIVAYWFPCTIEKGRIYVYLAAAQLESMHGFRFSSLKGGELKIRNVKAGNLRVSYPDGPPAAIPACGGDYPYSIPAGSRQIEALTPFVISLEDAEHSGGIIGIY